MSWFASKHALDELHVRDDVADLVLDTVLNFARVVLMMGQNASHGLTVYVAKSYLASMLNILMAGIGLLTVAVKSAKAGF